MKDVKAPRASLHLDGCIPRPHEAFCDECKMMIMAMRLRSSIVPTTTFMINATRTPQLGSHLDCHLEAINHPLSINSRQELVPLRSLKNTFSCELNIAHSLPYRHMIFFESNLPNLIQMAAKLLQAPEFKGFHIRSTTEMPR